MTLAARHVTVHGAGRSRLADVSLTLDPAVPTLVVGPNGAGKTTLIRILVGLQRPHRGEVRWRDATLASLTARERAEAVAWLPQHPRLEEGLTALDVVAAARYRFREPLWQAHDAALDALSRLDAAQWAERPMTTLSGGEAQRVRLAALAAQEASWWLLDEPFNHLDPEVQLGLLEAVQQKHGQGGGVVLVTHDLTLVPRFPSARLIALDAGRIAYDGDAAAPEVPQQLGALFRIAVEEVTAHGATHFVLGRPSA